jgi:hypothetical protein
MPTSAAIILIAIVLGLDYGLWFLVLPRIRQHSKKGQSDVRPMRA